MRVRMLHRSGARNLESPSPAISPRSHGPNGPPATLPPRPGGEASVTAVSVRGPALEGTLADLPLPELLSLLATGAKTGVVQVLGGDGGFLVVCDGRVTLAGSDAGPTLEQVLIGSGVASPDSWEAAKERDGDGSSIVEALLAGGADEDQLRQVLYDQTVGAVFELLLPNDAPFEFFADERHEVGDRFTFGVDDLLADAARRVEAWKVIAETIPTTSMVMRLAHRLPSDDVTLRADDWHVLARVDGRASVADIIRTLGMSAFAVCAVLHGLIGLGVVEPADE